MGAKFLKLLKNFELVIGILSDRWRNRSPRLVSRRSIEVRRRKGSDLCRLRDGYSCKIVFMRSEKSDFANILRLFESRGGMASIGLKALC